MPSRQSIAPEAGKAAKQALRTRKLSATASVLLTRHAQDACKAAKGVAQAEKQAGVARRNVAHVGHKAGLACSRRVVSRSVVGDSSSAGGGAQIGLQRRPSIHKHVACAIQINAHRKTPGTPAAHRGM